MDDFNKLEAVAASAMREGRFAEAIRIYLYMAEGDPSLESGYLGEKLGQCYDAMGDVPAARYWYGPAVEENPNGRLDSVAARERLGAERYSELLTLLAGRAASFAKGHLLLNYQAEDRWHGQLTAIVECRGFVGQGSAWFTLDHLRSFAECLAAYPLSEERPVALESGTFRQETGREIHLGIRFVPFGVRGLVRVTTQMMRPDQHLPGTDLAQNLTGSFLVTYGDISRFQSELMGLIGGDAFEARLKQTAT